MNIPFMYNFAGLSKRILYDFLEFNFSLCTPQVWLLCKRKPKIFVFKNVMERGIRKILNLKYVKLYLKFSGK